MFPEAVSRTGLLTAAARAVESEFPTPLFVDPYAERLAGPEGAALLAAHPAREFMVPALAVRTRLFDEVILSSIARGATQVLLIAAGLDTRAWRLDLPPELRWFEVDHAAVLDYKARVLEGVTPRVPRIAVGFDLRDANLAGALREAGFDPAQRTAVLVEGLLMYLAPADVEPLLGLLASLVPAGSTFAADIPSAASVEPSGVLREVLARFASQGAPWRFGTDDPRGVVGRAGWSVQDVVFPGHPRVWPERMLRPAFEHPPPGVPITWLVTASRAG